MAPVTTFCLLLAALAYATLFVFILTPSVDGSPFMISCRIPSLNIGKRYNCFDKKCWCTKTWADCSGNKGRLLFVPKLPPGIKFLKFTDNNLKTIPENFFINVTNITSVSLAYNFIANISDGAFKLLENLEVLFLQGNDLSGTEIKPLFEAKKLKCVDLRRCELESLPENLFDLSHLEQLYCHYNDLGSLNMSHFQKLRKLRILDWSHNNANNFLPERMKILQKLDLSSNKLSDFPQTCNASGAPFFPWLYYLNLKDNPIAKILHNCVSKLQTLDLSGSRLDILRQNTFNIALFPSLKYLYLEGIQPRIERIDSFAFNNSKLIKISLMFNSFKFSDPERVALDSFAGCPNLQTLQLSHNVFSGLSDQRFLQLFGNLTELDTLYMGQTFFEKITVQTFANFPRLKKLLLYANKLTEIPDAAFARNPELEELQLSNNKIITVRRTTFTEANLHSLEQLDLSGNPFACDCDLRWFSDWLRSNKTLFNDSRSSYNCSNLHQEVDSFTMPDQACLLSRDTNEFIVVSISLLLVAMTAVSTVFRYRWHLRLVLYEVFRGRNDVRRRRLEEGNFDYDVFVSYASEDLPWVREHLMPELEDRLGLRLCVHERDFIPGKNIVENIADCVESSKKILMVFSNDFVQSQWCQFELAFCLRHAMDTDDTLILLCVDDVASRDLTSSMMAVMKTTTYIQWVDDRDAIASFWGRMRMALHEVVPDGDQ